MSAFKSAVAINTGSTAVTSVPVTVPAGTLTSDNVGIIINTATATAGGHTMSGTTGSGTLAVPSGGLNGQTVTTVAKVTVLLGTGHTAGDVVTIACPASGITSGIMFVYDSTVVFDACGPNLTSASSANETTPDVTTSVPNCLVVNLVCGCKNLTVNLNSVGTGTIQTSLNAAGSGTRWSAFGVSDRVVAAAGLSGTVLENFSGTLAGAAGQQISFAPAPVAGGDNPGWGIQL